MLRALLQSNSSYKLKERIPGSVFAEASADSITFNRVDFRLIKAAYSQKYDDTYAEVLKSNPSARNITGSPKKTNLKKNPFDPDFRKRWNIIMVGVNLLGMIVAVWLLALMLQQGYFKKHYYRFGAFFKQGIIVLGISFVYFLFYMIAVVIRISSVYISRKDTLFLVQSKPASSKAPIDVATVFISAISILSIFGVLRAFYIFLSQKSENIIRQKDLELAKLGELHK